MKEESTGIKKIVLVIFFAVVLYTISQNISNILNILTTILNIFLPFLLGCAIAFILNIPMNMIERNIIKINVVKTNKRLYKIIRPVSLIISIFFVIAILYIALSIVLPDLINMLVDLGDSIEKAIPEVKVWLMELFENNKSFIKFIESAEIDIKSIMNGGLIFFKSGALTLLSSSVSIVGVVVNFIISIIFACYILLQREALARQFKKVLYAFLSKEKAEYVLYIGRLSYKTFSNFINGQCIDAIILGIMFFITMSVLKLPYALLIGVLISVTALIPIVGAFIGCIIGAFLIFVQSPMQAIIFIALFLVLQQIEGNLIYPKVVGNSVGLPSIWVLLSITVGGGLMGVIGMLISVPLISVVYNLFKEWINNKLKEKEIEVL